VSPVRPLLVIDVVGLTPALLAHAPRIRALAAPSGFTAALEPPLPAVTCTSQATLVTGKLPRDHGIVGNGWYFRDLAEVLFWRQPDGLVRGEKVWEAARRRRPEIKTAKLFWWYNLYSAVDLSATPRPHYAADGAKHFGIYTEPPALERELVESLGPFPFLHFWGPAAGLPASDWIARAARAVLDRHRPDLALVYLPHLDYDLQRFGPDDARVPAEVAAVDRLAGDLAEHARAAHGARVVVLSEYGIERVEAPVHPNRALREAGLLRVRESRWVGETLDAGASRAFAVADHQVAHVYVRDPAADLATVADRLERLPGVERVLDDRGKREVGLDHERAGDLVLVAAPGRWFTYYPWLDDARAPDFARTVDIHRKPGYDPCELFVDPALRFPRLRVASRLAQKALGFRYLVDVVPLDASLVRGSHGRPPAAPEHGAVLVSTERTGAADRLPMTAVKDLLLATLFAEA